jgi:taurine transport system permease protein
MRKKPTGNLQSPTSPRLNAVTRFRALDPRQVAFTTQAKTKPHQRAAISDSRHSFPMLISSGYFLIRFISGIGFLSVWEIAARLGLMDTQFVPAPSEIFVQIYQMIRSGELIVDIAASTWRILVGFTLSALIGIPLGIVLGSFQPVRWIVNPLLSVVRPLPSLAWIPISLLWLGIGETQKYAIVFLGTVAPLVVFVTDATLRVDSMLVKAALNLGASRLQVMKEVILPGALPAILSGLKMALAIAWTCIISAEMIGARKGLGFLIWNAKEGADIGQVMAAMLMISATVVVIDAIFRWAEVRLIPWKRSEATA